MASRRKSLAAIYTLRLELQHIEPLIWRRVQVPGDILLPKLHDVLQVLYELFSKRPTRKKR